MNAHDGGVIIRIVSPPETARLFANKFIYRSFATSKTQQSRERSNPIHIIR